jgi:PAS domain S-box-containing protein
MGDDLALPEKALISQLMLDAVGQALIATNSAGMVTVWNAAAERMYGWSALEAVGLPIAELTVPEISQSQAAEIFAALADGHSWTGEFTVQRRDGTRFPAIVSDSGIYNDSGDLVGIIGVSTDLTETRKAELARLDSEVRLQAIVDNSPVILVAFDAEGTITLAEGLDLASLGIAGG